MKYSSVERSGSVMVNLRVTDFDNYVKHGDQAWKYTDIRANVVLKTGDLTAMTMTRQLAMELRDVQKKRTNTRTQVRDKSGHWKDL